MSGRVFLFTRKSCKIRRFWEKQPYIVQKVFLMLVWDGIFMWFNKRDISWNCTGKSFSRVHLWNRVHEISWLVTKGKIFPIFCSSAAYHERRKHFFDTYYHSAYRHFEKHVASFAQSSNGHLTSVDDRPLHRRRPLLAGPAALYWISHEVTLCF